ncbi:hypothetical protein MVG78_21070 (plasmid) [Roseomonas gilardii subsp. gilardii]|uniref:hypothetical protein n=1 Tax=Roseomonas gilardii TaxID=257708 RepID=UPI001FFA61BA|nr:hypothetical protein [Roseomonas gilardii]UPG74823.1 hypothetical protein MVG78_21070 [Roseomonas gilardii subsp. gilardii]
MGQVHHGCATATAAVRRAIQHSQESLRVLAKRDGINPKTVAKWKKRSSTNDRRTSPAEPRSTVFSVEDEAVVVAFRRHTLLPPDDCLYALQPSIPHLTRSSLHRCLQRHGIQFTNRACGVYAFHHGDHSQLRRHLADFLDAHNLGHRLKTLKGPTPHAFICKQWAAEPERFRLNPLRQMPGLNSR